MFKAACIQLRSTQSVSENIETASKLIRAAAEDGATYIQTPEMTHLVETGRAPLMEKIVEEHQDQGVKAFGALAKELGITLHIGSLAILRGDGKVANRAFVFGPDGGLIVTYDKIHMFDVDLDNGERWRESNTYEPGITLPVVETVDAKIGVAICYDVRFPEVFRRQALAGASILTAPACFTQQTGKAHWHVLMRSRAIENASFMISAAQGGIHDDGRKTFGHSIIVDPWGNVLADSEDDEPGFISAKIELQDVVKARKRIPVLTHGREFDTSSVSYSSEE